MRHGMTLAIASLLVVSGLIQAQERISLPPPEPGPAGPPATLSPPTAQAPVPPSPLPPSGPPQPLVAPPSSPYTTPPPPPPPGPYAPYPPYPPPPGMYPVPPPYPPPPVVFRDPANPTFWIGFEGLLWWTKNQPLSVPVVTTGPGSQGATAGNLGAPGTTSLNGPLNYGAEGGFRFFIGGWFDSDHTIGMEGSFFDLGRQSAGFGVFDRSGTGSYVINEPVVGAPYSTQVSAPGVETGNVVVGATSRFGGGDVDVLYNLYRAGGWTINLLGGYRYLELDESLTIAANSTVFVTTTYTDNMGNVLATAPPGSTIAVVDQFCTRNEFNGAQIGAEFQYMWGRWSIDGVAKLAVGATHEEVTVNGFTNVNPVNGNQVSLAGGNYANLQIGQYAMNRFAVAPEGQLNVGYQFTPWIRGQVGYSFLYLSSVVRPGNQIDNTYDGVSHPCVPMTTSSYWGQGLNLSVKFSF